MMTTATDRPDTLRISFIAPSTEDSKHVEMEIVCYLRLTETGFEILYLHHVIRQRDGEVGPFNGLESTSRFPLVPSLLAIIQNGVMHEFWNAFSRSVRVFDKSAETFTTKASEINLT